MSLKNADEKFMDAKSDGEVGFVAELENTLLDRVLKLAVELLSR